MRFGLIALPLLAMSVDHVEAATKKSTAAIPPLSCRLFHQADVANLCTQAGPISGGDMQARLQPVTGACR
jgi:hypothetical protein